MAAADARTLDEQLGAIARHFDLGRVVSYERLGGTNQNYALATETGTFVCKVITNAEFDDILRGIPFLTRLQEHAFPSAVYYLPTPSGDVAYRSADCNAVVLRHTAGERPVPSRELNYRVGMCLARLHSVDPEGLPAKAHWLDETYLPTGITRIVDAYGEQRVERILRVFAGLRDFHPAELPQAIIHGDLDPGNSLVDNDGSVTFLDWQDVGVGAAVIDFAQAVLGYCFIDRAGTEYWAYGLDEITLPRD